MQEMEKTVRFIAYLNDLKWSIGNGFVNIKENSEGDGEFRVIYNDKRQVLVFDYDVDDFVPVEDWFHVPFTVKVHWIFQKRLSDFGTGHIKWPVFFTPVRDHALLPRRKHDHDADDLMSAAIPQMRHAFKGRADLLHVSVP